MIKMKLKKRVGNYVGDPVHGLIRCPVCGLVCDSVRGPVLVFPMPQHG